MKNNQKKIKKSFFAAFALILIFAIGVTTAAAETSVVWSKNIGDVSAADMSEDGSVIYAAVGSQIFVYDSAGVQQNTFTVGGTVVKLVCTADGTRAAFYTDGNEVYYIDNGQVSWIRTFTSITDIDINTVGSVLIVESTKFHKLLNDGSTEYDSASGSFNQGVLDPKDAFVIVDHSGSTIDKYILSTTDQYWGKINNNTFNTAFQNYQNVIVLNTDNQTFPIILSANTLGSEIFSEIYNPLSNAISNDQLSTTNAYTYYDTYGSIWTQETSSPNYPSRSYAACWVYNNKMWIAGGSGYNDVWSSSDGVNWTLVTSAAAWSKRLGAVSWVYDNKMWIAGGGTSTTLSETGNNEVWYSTNGVSWTRATAAAGWSKRLGAVSWVYDNKMWIAGGFSGGTTYNDVWYSTNGVSWTRATAAAGWSVREHAVSWVYDNKMWIAGGYNGGTGSSYAQYNDVWYSTNGVSWTRATSAAGWSARQGAVSWVFDNKMWIAGGSSGGREVWYSTDGASWTSATAAAPWTSRSFFCTWNYNDKIWIGNNNIWSMNTDPDSQQIIFQPAYDETYLFYNPTVSIQHTQTTYSNAVIFNSTYEMRTKPSLSIYSLQATKTFTGTVQAISLSDRGDWLGTLTSSNVYHDQITNAGFGTEYSDNLGSTGTAYDIATANSAAMSIVGQSQFTDIYSMTTARVGTYTAGGAVTHVDIADKNALWAASGGEDGKVYVFSKDESSNWYLEYSSDSEDPITALRMSARGEFILAGRTGSLTLYQTNAPQQTTTDFWLTLYVYKDSDSYRNAAVNVSVYTNNQWTSFAQGLTDSAGKYVVMVTAGQNYKFDIDNGQKLIIYQASPSVTSLTASIYSTPISSSLTYEAEWDPETNSITFDYHDSAGQTQSVTVRILRTDNWDVVYENTFTNQQSIEQNLPMIDDTVTYKVEMSAQRVSGLTRNTFFVSSSRDIVSIPLDQNLKNILFVCFLIFIAGLFSYYSAVRGPIVVAFMAVLFVYMGWLTIPWYWVTVAVVIAILAAFTQRR